MIPAIVYSLCAITSFVIAALLFYNYRRTRFRFLLWSTLCFCGLVVNNVILFVDMVVFPQGDLSLLRTVPSTIGVGILLYGFIWDVT
jgi:hypothetical protein